MKQTAFFQVPNVDGSRDDVLSLVLYSAMHEPLGNRRKARVVGRFVVLERISFPIQQPETGIINPYALDKVTPSLLQTEAGSAELYGYNICHGLLNVRSGHPVVRELFQRVGDDVPYKKWQWIPGVFLQLSYERYYAAVLGLLPAVKDSSSEPLLAFHPWQDTCQEQLKCA